MSAEGDRAVVEGLYKCFAAHDGDGMAACYAADAIFSDPVFPSLRGKEVGGMWRMLTARAADLVVELEGLTEERGRFIAHWTARYTFTGTGRKVVNRVMSEIDLKDGKIVAQHDHFDFPAWQAQALGAFGKLLGWSGLPGSMIRAGARKNLAKFLAKHP